MANKDEFKKIIDRYHPAVKNAGTQLSKAVKAAEEDIARMYKISQAQVEIQMSKLQKEKIYYNIGKETAALMLKGAIQSPALEKYMEKLAELDKNAQKKKKSIKAIARSRKKKASSGNAAAKKTRKSDRNKAEEPKSK